MIGISPIDSPVDKVDCYEIYANIDILATQVLLVMKFLPHTLKITHTIMCKIIFKSYSNTENLPQDLNKGFLEPPYMS